MNIGMQTWGSEGDINPFLALASGLAQAGHRVTLAITSADRKDYGGIARGSGFSLRTAEYIGRSEEHLNDIGRRLIGTSGPLEQLRLIYDEMFEPGVAAMYETARELCRQNDLVVGHFIHHPLHTAAEKERRPYITVTLNHFGIPTRLAPPPGMPDLGRWFNGLAWKFSERMLNRVLLPYINRLRKAEGMDPVATFRDVWESPVCNLIAVSPLFCPPRKDWGAHQKVCGFFGMDEGAARYGMPEGLEGFLDNGPPPVYMTLGSMTGTENNALLIDETTRLLVDAVRIAGCRAIIQSRWTHVTGIPDDERIFRVGHAPYGEVFPRCAAVIHHGGAGTTHTATLCGCPSVVIAHIPDQFFWGDELRRLGIGGRVLNRRRVTPGKIAGEILRLLGNRSMAERAQAAGERLRAEDGVARAAEIIEGAFPAHAGPPQNGLR